MRVLNPKQPKLIFWALLGRLSRANACERTESGLPDWSGL